ncbi:MAG TPA: hypothetical protein VFK07_00940 [Candidatus Paceibacterota bacterium]|nr:hypothetical protein [Candidatus Paceibacterota bacterium]
MSLPVGRFVSLRDFAPRDPEFFKRLAEVKAKEKEVERDRELATVTRLHNELILLGRKRRFRFNNDLVDILFLLFKERRPLELIDYLHVLLERGVIFPDTKPISLLETLRRIMRTR